MSEVCSRPLDGRPAPLSDALETQLESHHAATRHLVRTDFLKYVDVRGKRILEVGSDTQFSVASLLVAYGAEEVVCSNPFEPPLVDIPSNKIKFLQKYTEEIDYPPDYFDIVFGISVLEHVADLDAFFRNLAVLLKPDGLVWLEGSYFWTTPHGHHLWVYDESEEAFFSFADPTDPVRCPIKPYEHLVYSEAELAVVLSERGVRPSHVKLILDHLVRSPNINRIAPSKIKKAAREVFAIECFDVHEEFAAPAEIIAHLSENYARDDLSLLKFVMFGVLPSFRKQIASASIRDYFRQQRKNRWLATAPAHMGAEGLQYAHWQFRDEVDDLHEVINDLKQANTALLAEKDHLGEMNQRVSDVLNTTITSIVGSSSWRYTRSWHKSLGVSDITKRSDGRLDTAASTLLDLYQSVAWDLAAPARLISHLFNRRGRLR